MDQNQQQHHRKLTLGQRMADKITCAIGNWTFLIIETIVLMGWLALNIIGWVKHWDPYPFVFLNLLVGLQAAYAAPVILMSQNRTEERDQRKSEMDLATDRKAEREIEQIQAKLERIERKINDILSQK